MTTGWLLRSSLTAAFSAGLISLGFVLAGSLNMTSRVGGDSIIYLSMAQWIVDGHSLSFAGYKSINTALPIGYPLVIAGMAKLGLATTLGLKALNLACFAIGLAACRLVLRRSFDLSPRNANCVLLFVAGSATFVELVRTIASEALFFGVSMVVLAVLSQRRWSCILGAALLTAAAISIRTVGIALIPAVLIAIAQLPTVRPRLTTRTLCLASILLAAGVVCGALSLMRTTYFSYLAARYPSHPNWPVLIEKQIYKLSVFGEYATNLRAEDYPYNFSGEFVLAGVFALSLVGIGTYVRHRLAPVDVYFLCYAFIVFVYPFFNFGIGRRFWMPMLPLLATYCLLGMRFVAARAKIASSHGAAILAVYLAIAVTMGSANTIRDVILNRGNEAQTTEALIPLQNK